MRILLLHTLIFGFLAIGVHAQNIDSLTSLVSQTDDEEILAELYYNIGLAYFHKDLDSSTYYYEKAIELGEGLVSDSLMKQIYNQAGTHYIYVGIHDKALKYLYKGLELSEGHEVDQAKFQFNIGTIHYRQSELEKALEFFRMSQRTIEKHQESLGNYYFFFVANLSNNIGIIYENQGKYDSALMVYSSGLSASWKAEDTTAIGNLYSNIGKMYEAKNNYELALSNHKEALRFRIASGNNYGMARSYGHLAVAFLSLEVNDSALYYGKLGLKTAEEIGTPETVMYNKMVISQVLKALGRGDEAYDMYVEFTTLKDSLTEVNNSKELAQIELQYEKDKLRREAEIAQREREFWMYGTIGALIFTSLLAISLFFLQRNRSKKHELLKDNALLENKHLELENANLEADLEFKNKELTTNVMYLMKKNELLNEISQRLLEIKKGLKLESSKSKVQKIIVELNSASTDDVWEEFELRFNAVYNDFYERLTEKFPDLTKNDRNLCAFLRLNMSTKEICAITRQSVKSLNVSRSRLRKKLGITNTETSMMSFLETI